MTMVKDTRPLARDAGREATADLGNGRDPELPRRAARLPGNGSEQTTIQAWPDRAPTAPEGPKRDGSTSGWELFVGSIIAVALLKEARDRVGGHPIAIRTRQISLKDSAAGLVLLGDALHRIGARTLGVKDARRLPGGRA